MPTFLSSETGVGATHTGAVSIERSATTDLAIHAKATGDTADRWAVDASGTQTFNYNGTAGGQGVQLGIVTVQGVKRLALRSLIPSSGPASLVIQDERAQAVAGNLRLIKRRTGDAATPAGDSIGWVAYEAWDGAALTTGAYIESTAYATFTGSTAPQDLNILVPRVGTNTLTSSARFVGDTVQLGIGTSLYSSVVPTLTDRLRVNAPTTVPAAASVTIAPDAVGTKPLVVQGLASQTASLIEAQDSTGASLWAAQPTQVTSTLPWITTGTLSVGATPSTNGTIRLPYSGIIGFRNLANTGNVLALTVDGNDRIYLNQGGGEIAINGGPIRIGSNASNGIAWWGGTPAVQNTGWSVTAGYTADKTFNPETASLLESNRVLGTLIDILKSYGLLGA